MPFPSECESNAYGPKVNRLTRDSGGAVAGCPSAAQDLAPLAVCTTLDALHVDTCRLTAFPLVVSTLPHLRVLGLGNNAIPSVPQQITELSELSALDLRNNNLTAVLPQLALLPLRSLLVEGNMLRTLRRSVLDAGTPALLDYLRSRLPLAP